MLGSPSSPAGPRLWRPAAQRHVKNAWSSIAMQLPAWSSASAKGLAAATSLVNAHLSHCYVDSMDLGVLQAMHGIRAKAREKYFHQGEGSHEELLKIYKDMVESVFLMLRAKGSMKTYVKGSVKGPLIEFSDRQYLHEDAGDGDGLAVFSILSLAAHEMLAEELINMFLSELWVKWLIIIELHCALYSSAENDYPSQQASKEILESIFVETKLKIPGWIPKEKAYDFGDFFQKHSSEREVLQVYLTAWLAEINVKRSRIADILKVVSEEIQLQLSM